MILSSPSSSTHLEIQSGWLSSQTITAFKVVEFKVAKLIINHRCQHLVGQQQIEGVDKGGGAGNERQKLQDTSAHPPLCQH